MSIVLEIAECSQCGREAPFDSAELVTWRHGHLALEGEVGEGLLVCPDCDAEDRERAFEEGEGG
jgi:Zn ribbon nucleic-acid-binding protein